MGPSLLDVNVLIAHFWPAHVHHAVARRWMDRHARAGWVTTPHTQAAFVRITSNPSFSPHSVRPQDAVRLLEANLSHPGHVFWPDELGYGAACASLKDHLTGHRQVMDAYLLGLALHRGGRLATFDEGIVALARAAGVEARAVLRIKTDD